MGLLGCVVLGGQPGAHSGPSCSRSVGHPLLDGFPALQGCPKHSSGQTGTAGIVCLWKRLGAFSYLERNPAEGLPPQLGQKAVGHILAKGIRDRQGGF